MSYRQALDKRQRMKLACFDSDRIRKIDFDNEAQGTAYTAKGEAYERILKRFAEAKIDPIVFISEEWLPVGSGAWLVIDGNPEQDNLNDGYNCQPYLYNNWSPQGQLYWRSASMELNKALRHPPLNPSAPRLPIHENGWASTLDCMRFLRPKVSRYESQKEWLLGSVPIIGSSVSRYVTINTVFSYVAGATDIYGILEEGSSILSFGFIRAKSGHSGDIAELVNRSAYTSIPPLFANGVSCICHKTQRQYIREIFYNGLKPGEMIRAGGRKHVNLSPPAWY